MNSSLPNEWISKHSARDMLAESAVPGEATSDERLREQTHVKTKTVFLLQELIPSYRAPIFKRLAEQEGIDLTVFYSCQTDEMRRENLKSADNLEGFRTVELRRQTVASHSYQFGILWQVLRYRPDVMIASNADCIDRMVLLLLCKLLRVRMLWFFGGVPYKDPQKIHEYAMHGRLNRLFGKYNPRRWLKRRADGLIVYSEHARDYFASLGFDTKRIWVANNSTDTDALARYRQHWLDRQNELDALTRRFSPQGEKVLFLLGRLNQARKADLLLQALQRLQSKQLPVSLVIVGDGGERAALERQVAQLGLQQVFFEGAIYDEMELAKYFMTSDVFVTPGVASLAIKMAMSFGKPVVTVDYGLEVHDVEEGVNGFVFPMDDLDALTATLEKLLTSEELMNRLSAGGIATIANKININRMIQGFKQAIFA